MIIACTDKQASNELIRKCLRLLNTIVSNLHQIIFNVDIATKQVALITALKDNIKQLTSDCINRSNYSLKSLLLRIIHLLCLNYGLKFTSEVIFIILNPLMINYKSISSISSPHQLLVHFIRKLRLPFGSNIKNCIADAVNCCNFKDNFSNADAIPYSKMKIKSNYNIYFSLSLTY